ncbi:Spy/CpxP family protein refolding chaperone [Undibacterium sp.]|jgi:protein CpxP|uniref:Spy/CpxP family protein refolding chaperone n=1 Tax=Undibacterium sp. TaxID=1914977 RepID=UPI002CDEBC67|nr:Spy/CpxP family protein refolding chaperone [Undibacterium sp.]HTD06683.1 Spy/CpxP family protein refolding chaperone [Undibacterium sp.]
MNSLKNKFFIGLTALTMAAGAYAQSASAPAASAPAAKHGPSEMDRSKWAEKMKERMAKHQAELHAKLKLTAAQEPAWKTFIDAMAPGPMPMRKPEDRKAMEKLSTPERMEQGLQMMKEHQARMEAHLAALKIFYAVLTPEQQKVFDDAHRHMRGHRGPWEHHGDAKPADKKQ